MPGVWEPATVLFVSDDLRFKPLSGSFRLLLPGCLRFPWMKVRWSMLAPDAVLLPCVAGVHLIPAGGTEPVIRGSGYGRGRKRPFIGEVLRNPRAPRCWRARSACSQRNVTGSRILG